MAEDELVIVLTGPLVDELRAEPLPMPVEHYCCRALEDALGRRAECRSYGAELIDQVRDVVAGLTSTSPAPAESVALAYTPAQVAEMLNVSTDSVRQACRDGELQHWRWGDRILIARDEVEQVARAGLARTPD